MLHPASDLSGAPPDTRFAVPADAPSEVLARTAVAATVHAQARARAGAWEEAAATLRASVELRERLVHAEAAGPAVAARGWHELAIACLALDRADEARTLLGRARSVVALAEPGLAVDALRDAVDDAWSRVVALDDAARTADAGLRLDDALASVMDAASVATVAAVADVTATGGALASSAASGAPWVDAWASNDDDAPPRQATPETAVSVIAPARPVPMPDLPDTPSAFVDDLPAADEEALTFLTSGTGATAGATARAAESPALADDDLPTFDAWGQGPGGATDEDIQFLSPTSPTSPLDTSGAGAAHRPAEAALAGASRPRAKVVLPEFPEETEPERRGLLSRILRRNGR